MPSRIYKTKYKQFGKYKSQLEAKVAKILGKTSKYEPCKLDYFLKKKYIPDFIIYRKDGVHIYLEVKGYLRSEDQRKMRAVQLFNQGLDIRFFFPRDGKVMGSLMKNSQWCEKYGFKYCIGKIPRSWYK